MFAKMTPDTLDRPDSDTSRRLGNLDLAKFRERRARTLGGRPPGNFGRPLPPRVTWRGATWHRRHGGLLRAPSTSRGRLPPDVT